MSLYLVQALYGTKSRGPELQTVKVEDTAVDVSSPMEAEADDEIMVDLPAAPQQIVTAQMTARGPECKHTTDTDTSIAEAINHQELDAALAALKAVYDAQSNVNTQPYMDTVTPPVENARIHPARQQQLLGPEDPSNEEPERAIEDESWAPTGSNVLPLGVQEKPEMSFLATLRQRSASRKFEVEEKSRKSSKQSLTKFLPPKGDYYDQKNLVHVFGNGGFQQKGNWCGTCWTKDHPGSENCQRLCPMCGTKEHPGQVCTRLYCSARWYKHRKVSVPSGYQIRPTENCLKMLFNLGMVKPSSSASTPIHANRTHPDVVEFYNGQWSRLLWKKPKSAESFSEADVGYGSMAKALATQGREAGASSTDGNSVNPTSNPQLPLHTLQISDPDLTKSSVYAYSTMTTQGCGSLDVPTEAEGHLQKLEEEILRLKMDNIMKDREIRLLRSELGRLRAADGDVQTGNKRPRLHEDDALLSTLH